MKIKIPKFMVMIFIVAILLFIVWSLNCLRNCSERRDLPQQVVKNDYLLEQKTYREPIIKLPLITKDKQPVKTDVLPIPKKEVDKTITIETTSVEGERQETVLIIDKEGGVYKAKDTPETTRVEVVKWKPKRLAFDFRFGYSLVYSFGNDFAHCLSLDYLRFDNFYFGSEIGLGLKEGRFGDLLIGLSVKYKVLDVGAFGNPSSIRLSILGGWNFINDKPYLGLNLKW